MAALRMESRSDSRPEVTRLGHSEITTTVHTWRTFVRVEMQKNGRTGITVTRDGKVIHTFDLDTPEAGADNGRV